MDRRRFIRYSGISAFAISASGFTFPSDKNTISGCPTTRDMLGPFYKKGAPFRNIISEADHPKKIGIKVSGKLISCETMDPIPDAIIDIWHCDHKKNYDEKGHQCRGRFRTDKDGNYWFKTFIPPPYGGRPKHIHYLVNKLEGYKELATQLYFQGDRKIKKNNWVKYPWDQKRILAIEENAEGEASVVLDLYLETIS